MTNGDFNLAGISVLPSLAGETSSTQDFINAPDVGPLVLGVIFNDADGDTFYDPGEGLSGVTVSVNGIATSSWASGGYQIDPGLTGPVTVTFSGGILSVAVSVVIDLDDLNRKVDLGLLGISDTPSILVRDDGDFAGIDASGSTDTIPAATPTSGDDNLSFTDADDLVSGLAGNDTLRGLGGNDVIYGNPGLDMIYGNTGFDTIYGGQDADRVFGGQQDDVIYGNFADDALYGNYGDDDLFGGQGSDVLFGGQGNDYLFGNRDNDQLFGNLGDDLLYGGSGADIFYYNAGQGNDVIGDFDALAGDQLVLGGTFFATEASGSTVLIFEAGGTLTLAGVPLSTFELLGFTDI